MADASISPSSARRRHTSTPAVTTTASPVTGSDPRSVTTFAMSTSQSGTQVAGGLRAP